MTTELFKQFVQGSKKRDVQERVETPKTDFDFTTEDLDRVDEEIPQDQSSEVYVTTIQGNQIKLEDAVLTPKGYIQF